MAELKPETRAGAPANIPAEYLEGYEKARLVNPALADKYVAHTIIGDPVMDAIIEEMSPLPQERVHHFINAGMQEDFEELRQGPEALRRFFVDAPQPEPEWLDFNAFHAGARAFQRNAVEILTAFVTGTLIDGFATLISKSFTRTGRIFDNGVWRLKQNNRHQTEIFFPGGLERQGDGWKLSVRIRFIHAQVRWLLANSEEWEREAWGTPISAAHVAFAVACFASRTLLYSEKLGARYTPEERASFMQVWRYAGYLMGVPEEILFADEDGASEMFRIGAMCEPPPDVDAIVMSNALINSAPLVAGIDDPKHRAKLVNKIIYPVSRGLIGNHLADILQFPKVRTPCPIFLYRVDQQIQHMKARVLKRRAENFSALVVTSAYDDAGLSYRLPDNVHAEESGKW